MVKYNVTLTEKTLMFIGLSLYSGSVRVFHLMTIDGLYDVCSRCGHDVLCVYVCGLPYCKTCFREKKRSSDRFREQCEQLGIVNIEDLHEKNT